VSLNKCSKAPLFWRDRWAFALAECKKATFPGSPNFSFFILLLLPHPLVPTLLLL
jgi:hypothetical protein